MTNLIDNPECYEVPDDPHDPNESYDSRHGFVWKGVHFERSGEDKRGLHVYVASRTDSKMVVISPEGKITLESMT